MSAPTASQQSALRWLGERNGDGVFDRNHVVVAAGQRAPVMRATWNALRDLGLVEFYLNDRRLRLTDAGRAVGQRAELTGDHEVDLDELAALMADRP